jgi:hypothetical protein
VRAYLDYLKYGEADSVTMRAYARSLRFSPYLKDAAIWRIRYGAAVWDKLSEDTRRRMIDEAVWFSRLSSGGFLAVVLALPNEPARARFLTRRAAMTARIGGEKP